ncbi:unnamed protein product [Caenorhabditis angaria]|uniref:Uncharacterized protein n=1 Tax=Caenorhabditis angaria TaxID=860376 RepID=A0A9P1ICZ8_9PELO|nr:unnamed protein product [Caenorhabditis angaria]
MPSYASGLIGFDFPRSHKSPFANARRIDRVYSEFLKYGEELTRNLEQPAICRAYASYFEQQEERRNSGREEKLKKRSLKRHLHLVSHLQNREIGQNSHGKRNLASTILSSECREFRFDQTLYGRLETMQLIWRNRRIIAEDSEKLIDYETMNRICELNPVCRLLSVDVADVIYYPLKIDQIMIVDVFGMDKYLLILRDGFLQVINWENPTEQERQFDIPNGLKNRKIGWKNINESIYFEGKRRNEQKSCDEYVFMVFNAYPFELVTSFTIDEFACPRSHGISKQIAINDDFIEVLTEEKALLFSFDDILTQLDEIGSTSWDFGGEPDLNLPRFGEPLRIMNGNLKGFYCCPRLSPLIVGFPESGALLMQNLRDSEGLVEFDENASSDFGMVSLKNLIFPDPPTSVFLVYENCDLVKYCVGYLTENHRLRIEEIWRIRMFPKVEDRKRDNESLEDCVKIHDTTLADENLIVNLSIDYANIHPNGIFDPKIHPEKIIVQFTYIIDFKNGEILRVIPIVGLLQNQRAMQIDDDLLIIEKKSEIIAGLEVWELIEPQQFIGFQRNHRENLNYGSRI